MYWKSNPQVLKDKDTLPLVDRARRAWIGARTHEQGYMATTLHGWVLRPLVGHLNTCILDFPLLNLNLPTTYSQPNLNLPVYTGFKGSGTLPLPIPSRNVKVDLEKNASLPQSSFILIRASIHTYGVKDKKVYLCIKV